jgi:hypothetical protein
MKRFSSTFMLGHCDLGIRFPEGLLSLSPNRGEPLRFVGISHFPPPLRPWQVSRLGRRVAAVSKKRLNSWKPRRFQFGGACGREGPPRSIGFLVLGRRWRLPWLPASLIQKVFRSGLVPKQNSSGGKDRLSNISKRGDRYLRSRSLSPASSRYITSARKLTHQQASHGSSARSTHEDAAPVPISRGEIGPGLFRKACEFGLAGLPRVLARSL